MKEPYISVNNSLSLVNKSAKGWAEEPKWGGGACLPFYAETEDREPVVFVADGRLVVTQHSWGH